MNARITNWKRSACILALIAVMALPVVMGCAVQATATAKQDLTLVPELPPYSGPKARVSVAKFTMGGRSSSGGLVIETPQGQYRWTVQEQSEEFGGLEAMLTTALMESNRFQVLESELDPMKDEIELGEEGYTKEETRVEKGDWEGADLMVYAEITKWEPDASGSSAALGGILPGLLGGVKVGQKKTIVGMNLRMVDPRSRITLASKPVEAEATSWNLGLAGGGWGGIGALIGGLSKYEKTPMGTAINVAIAKATELVANATPQKYFKYE